MDVTLTLFKKSGSKEDNVFTGTFAGPEDHPGEWYLLTSDPELIATGLKFVIVEFVDVKNLTDGYAAKVKRTPHIDIRYKENYSGSLGYPRGSLLLAKDIKTWAINFIKSIYPDTEPEAVATSPAVTNSSTARDARTVKKEVKPPKKIAESSWFWPSVAVGTALVTAAGVFTGYQLLGEEEREDVDPLILGGSDDEDNENFTKQGLRIAGKNKKAEQSNIVIDTSTVTKQKRSPSESSPSESSVEFNISGNETPTWTLPSDQQQEEGEL